MIYKTNDLVVCTKDVKLIGLEKGRVGYVINLGFEFEQYYMVYCPISNRTLSVGFDDMSYWEPYKGPDAWRYKAMLMSRKMSDWVCKLLDIE